jgi:uncharacterized protein YprB with RNaseH-like and TPR domain
VIQGTRVRFARLKALERPSPQTRSGSPVERATKWVVDGPRGHAPDVPEGAARLAELLGASPSRNEFGEHLVLRRWFSEAIGCDPPSSKLNAAALRLLVPGGSDDVTDPQQWLFLDTETTGRAGGTGTYPFLIGIAWWDAGGLEVEQFFMREFSEEHSVLLALAERLAQRRVLVTFNGKSFDWPLIETRYRMTRTIHPPAPVAHIDFLHPARLLWRTRLPSVRLTELERHVLGWNRGKDLVSDLIPQVYFNYVRGGPPEPLVSVFHHNQMDLRGLAGLASRTVSLLDQPELHGQDALELYGVSRICERRGEPTRARALYERSIASDLPPETERAARQSLARLAKRQGDFSFACQMWEKMLGNSREGIEAYEQLAIYYEHHAREPNRAAALAHKALVELRNANRLGLIASGAYCQSRARFEQRLARLERKAGRALLDAIETCRS